MEKLLRAGGHDLLRETFQAYLDSPGATSSARMQPRSRGRMTVLIYRRSNRTTASADQWPEQ